MRSTEGSRGGSASGDMVSSDATVRWMPLERESLDLCLKSESALWKHRNTQMLIKCLNATAVIDLNCLFFAFPCFSAHCMKLQKIFPFTTTNFNSFYSDLMQ